MSMALPNTWHLRTVAENSGKPCWIDYKTTTSVLITPDNKDFFYICRGHLKDRTFCTPSVSAEDTAAKTREAELQREIEAIKKEYAEKQAKKKGGKKEDDKDKEKDKDKDKDKDADEKEKDDKIKAATEKAEKKSDALDDLPRIYSLHRNFQQMRIDRIRNAEMARRNRERLKDPNVFPSVPKGDI